MRWQTHAQLRLTAAVLTGRHRQQDLISQAVLVRNYIYQPTNIISHVIGSIPADWRVLNGKHLNKIKTGKFL